MERITIIGLGLIGGSIALGLKASRLENLEIIGSDRSRDAQNLAKKLGAVDRVEGDTAAAVKDAALVVIATPVRAVRGVMQAIAPHLPDDAVVTDAGSTKADVLRWAAEILPSHVSFVGGHPIAGKETPGAGAAESPVFRQRIYCVVPAVTAREGAVRTVLGLVQALGATPWFIDAEEHDRYLAAVSHVPILLSTALFTMARSSKAWNDLAPLAGPAFKDLTRLASGEPEMASDILATNRDAVLHWLDRYVAELGLFRDLLADGVDPAKDEELSTRLNAARTERASFLEGKFDRGAPRPPIDLPSASESLAGMFISARLAERLKDTQRIIESSAKERADRIGRGAQRELGGGEDRGDA